MEAHENTGKSAMLHIAEILIHGSDERHPLSQQKILEILKNKCNVTVNRKTVGKNLTRMKETGWPVECRQVMRTMNGKKYRSHWIGIGNIICHMMISIVYLKCFIFHIILRHK